MKNLGLFAALLAGSFAASCSSGKPAAPDARPAKADAAIAFDAAVDKPPFIVTLGKYEVRLDPDCNDPEVDADPHADPLDLLGYYGFEITASDNDPPGQYELWHNGFRLRVIDGRFYTKYTALGSDGTCFSNMYELELDGAFVSQSEARGRYVRYRDCKPTEAKYFIATPVPPKLADAAVVDTAPFDAPVTRPVPGKYKVRPDPPVVGDASSPIAPLDNIGLTVRVDEATGKVTIFFFAAVDTDGIIPVTDGKFDFVHGKGGTDGTVCPANGYAINGAFVSPTEFRGAFAAIYFCGLLNSGNYIATLDPPPDSAVAIDVAAPDAAIADGAASEGR